MIVVLLLAAVASLQFSLCEAQATAGATTTTTTVAGATTTTTTTTAGGANTPPTQSSSGSTSSTLSTSSTTAGTPASLPGYLPANQTCAMQTLSACNQAQFDCTYNYTTSTCGPASCSDLISASACASKNCKSLSFQTTVGNYSVFVCYNGSKPDCSSLSGNVAQCQSFGCTYYSDASACTSGAPPCNLFSGNVTQCQSYSQCSYFTAPSAYGGTYSLCYVTALGLQCSSVNDPGACDNITYCAYYSNSCTMCANNTDCTALRLTTTVPLITQGTTMSTTPYVAACQNLYTAEQCQARTDCSWSNGACSICTQQPCIVSVNCSLSTSEQACTLSSSRCVWHSSYFGLDGECVVRACSEYISSAGCSAANCSSLGTDLGANPDFICYQNNTLIDCSRYRSNTTCHLNSVCAFDSVNNFCYNKTAPYPCSLVTVNCDTTPSCVTWTGLSSTGSNITQCININGGPVCSSLYDSQLCGSAPSCGWYNYQCWSCPSTPCIVPTTTTTTTTSLPSSSTTQACSLLFNNATCSVFAPRCFWAAYQSVCLDCTFSNCSLFTTPAPIKCSTATSTMTCTYPCVWDTSVQPGASTTTTTTTTTLSGVNATSGPITESGLCRSPMCSDFPSSSSCIANSSCTSVGSDNTAPFDFVCYEIGSQVSCSILRSSNTCNSFSSCQWQPSVGACLPNGTMVPCSTYASQSLCPNNTCVYDIYAQYCRDPNVLPACNQYSQELECELFPSRCSWNQYLQSCNDQGVTFNCSAYSSLSSTVCNSVPGCQSSTLINNNISSVQCVACNVGSVGCGPDTTMCANLNQSQCLTATFAGRCLLNNLNQCVDLPCNQVLLRTDCGLLSQCQWSVAAMTCIDQGTNVSCSSIHSQYGCIFTSYCDYDPVAALCYDKGSSVPCSDYYSLSQCNSQGSRCWYDATAGNGYCNAAGASTPCFAYGGNQTTCESQVYSNNTQRCLFALGACSDPIPPTTTTMSTTAATTTPFINACAVNASLCDVHSVCFHGSVSESYTCSPCPQGYYGDPYVKCYENDSCNPNPCQSPRNCTGNLNPDLPFYFACTPCPLGYLEDSPTTCKFIDACLNNTCDVLSGCIVTGPVSYECKPCPSGYFGDPRYGTCQDINECIGAVYPCPSNSACTNTIGSYVCGPCNQGYVASQNGTCQEINECNPSPCDALSSCVQNGPGEFICSDCPQGYTTSRASNGSTTCHVNSCPSQVPNLINAQSSCTSSIVGSSCTVSCNAGYTGSSAVFTCNTQSNWDGAISCVAVTCATPTSLPANAVVQFGICSGSYQSGACPLICNAGYTGSATLTCGASGQFEGSLTCVPCPAGQYQNSQGQASCITQTACVLGVSYETLAPTASSDRVCTLVSPACSSTQYQTVAPTLTSNRVCSTLTVCSSTQYVSVSATASSDRQCTACSPCAAGTTLMANSCTSSQNSICNACIVCSSIQFQSSACTSTANTVCTRLAVCPIGYAQVTAPTATSNRVCSSFPTSVNAVPTNAATIFVKAQVTLQNLPVDTSSTFLFIFSTSVVQALQSKFSGVGVTVFNVTASSRRTGSMVVIYRVDVPSSQVTDNAALVASVSDTAALSTQIQSVGALVLGNSVPYGSVSASMTQTPTVNVFVAATLPTNAPTTTQVGETTVTTTTTTTTTTASNGGVTVGNGANTVTSSSPTTTIVIACVAGGAGLAIIVLIIVLVTRKPRAQAIIYAEEAGSPLQNTSELEIAEVKIPISGASRTRQASFFSSIRLGEDAESSA